MRPRSVRRVVAKQFGGSILITPTIRRGRGRGGDHCTHFGGP